LRANGSRECAPDDRLRDAIQSGAAAWIASSLSLLAMTTSTDVALDQPRALQLIDAQRIVHAAYRLLAAPRRAVALNRKQIIGGRRIAAMRDRGCRRHADHGYGTLRPVDPYR